jgi:hypothetical protein
MKGEGRSKKAEVGAAREDVRPTNENAEGRMKKEEKFGTTSPRPSPPTCVGGEGELFASIDEICGRFLGSIFRETPASEWVMTLGNKRVQSLL